MKQSITESGMRFGPFEETDLFYIERSPVYIAMQDHMKIVEFVSYDKPRNAVFMVEAKTTAPNPNSALKPERFGEYIGEIEQKMCNALDLYLHEALCDALPSGFNSIEHDHVRIFLTLVIRELRDEWLPPVKDALEKAINQHLRLLKIWKCNVVVLNEKRAKAFGIIEALPQG